MESVVRCGICPGREWIPSERALPMLVRDGSSVETVYACPSIDL